MEITSESEHSSAQRFGKDMAPVEEFIGDGVRRETMFPAGAVLPVGKANRRLQRTKTDALTPWLIGAAFGLASVLPMTLVLAASKKAQEGKARPLPPEHVTQGVLRKIGMGMAVPYKTKRFESTFVLFHLGFGLAAGALLGKILEENARRPVADAKVVGGVYGLLVWATSYFGWIPKLHIMSKEYAQSTTNSVSLALAHLAWGTSIAGMYEKLKGK